MIEIEKDVLLCDSCNKILADKEDKRAKEDCVWNEWGLVCQACYRQGQQEIPVIKKFKLGDDMSELFVPLRITFF